MLRFLGLLCGLAGLAALAMDVYRGPLSDNHLRLGAVAEYWAEIHRPSLIGLNSFTEKQLSPEVFDTVVLPFLNLPAALVFTILALLLLIGSRRRQVKKRGDMMFPR